MSWPRHTRTPPVLVVDLGQTVELLAKILDRLARVETHLHRLEGLVATQNEQLNELKTSLVAVFADFDAKLDQLNAQTDTFRPEAQATFDALKQAVADKQAELGDVDGSDQPAEPATGDGSIF